MIQIVKYILEGLAVALASYLVAGKKLDIKEIVLLGATAGMIFLVLEQFTPSVAAGARHGAGFGIGHRLVSNDQFGAGPYEGYTDEVAVEATAEEAEAVTVDVSVANPNSKYKLVKGMYAEKVLLAGFNEHAKAHNDDSYLLNPWDEGQTGGAVAEEAVSETIPATAAPVPVPVPVGPVIEKGNMYRESNALYSGDLVDITADGNFMQRGLIDSEIIFDKPLNKVGTNLSKLRLVHPNHSSTKQTPLNYGEPVYIMHNSYFNNMSLSKYVKYGDKLQSHQDGALFRAFKILDADNKERTGPIVPGTELYICRGDQEGDNVHLKVETDKTITSKNPQDAATKFKVALKRVFESHDRNLCVCPNEIIYP
jgi:hypothetical protein